MARWNGTLFSPRDRVLLEWFDETDPEYRGRVEWEVPSSYRERGELSDPETGIGINASNAHGLFPDKLTVLKKADTGVDASQESYEPIRVTDISLGDVLVAQNDEVTAEFEVVEGTLDGTTLYALGFYFEADELLGRRKVV
jgi:hypothetical protein